MELKPISTVCFDWDGTLCDSGTASLLAFRKSLAEFGITFTDAEYKAVYTPRWYLMYEAFRLPKANWEAADQGWLRHYREEETALLPGAAEVLKTFAAAGVQLGIVTSGTRKRVERELERFGLAGTFDALVCCEDVIEKKPHPEGLEKAFALLGCSRENCCYVGDTAEDVLMGKGARVFTVGILSEHVDCARLEACRPDVLLKTIADLPGALKPIHSLLQ